MGKVLQDSMVGHKGAEAPISMLEQYPLYNEYWDDKNVNLEKIKVPAYVLASFSSALHTTGSVRGYHDISSKDKLLRIHARQEWSDLNHPDNVDDLTKFYDYFVKGSLVGFNQPKVVNIRLDSYPIPNTKNTKLYLDSAEKLMLSPQKEAQALSYDAAYLPKHPLQDGEELLFPYKIPKKTWLIGYSWLNISILNDSHDDIDVFAQIGKQDASDEQPVNMNVPTKELIPPVSHHTEAANTCFLKYLEPTGSLRGSHAITKVDPKPRRFTGEWPKYTNTTHKAIPAGTIARLKVHIWPTGIVLEEGEYLTLKVFGHYMKLYGV
ncbi:hypothetical protein ACHAQK_002616 [Fusarium lateritium]